MMTALKFRNTIASPDDPVDTWPFEGILAAVERGSLPDWRRLAAAIRADPWGPVARQVLEPIRLSRSRLSTYMSGKVVPSAALMVRMRRVALKASETVTVIG